MKIIITVMMCLTSIPFFGCDNCRTSLLEKQKEIQEKIETFLKNPDSCDSLKGEEYYFLHGVLAAYGDALVILENNHIAH